MPERFRRSLWAPLGTAAVAAVLVAAVLAQFGGSSTDGAADAAPERLSCALPPQPADAPHPGMVWVPGGSLLQGDTVYPEEQPLRTRQVAGFWMDRTEVTNAEFAAFVAATGHVSVAEKALDSASHPGLPPQMLQPGAVVFIRPTDLRHGGDPRQWWQYVPGANWRHPGGPQTQITDRGQFPVVAVTIDDARAYARWKGRSLPTEAEWEWAARAARAGPAADPAQPAEANTWQGLFPLANSGADGFVGLAPVGCYAPNALGLFDLIGNVWELTADRYTPDHSGADNSPPDSLPAAQRLAPGPDGSAAGECYVIKGGSYLCAPNYCLRYRAGARQPQEADLATSHLGFRTILRAPGP